MFGSALAAFCFHLFLVEKNVSLKQQQTKSNDLMTLSATK